jgi:hypothetical protein
LRENIVKLLNRLNSAEEPRVFLATDFVAGLAADFLLAVMEKLNQARVPETV